MSAVLDKTLTQFSLEGHGSETSFFLPGRFTFEEFLHLHEDTVVSEWIDGKVLIMAAAAVAHQRIGSFLEKILGLYVEINDLGEVFRSPVLMRMRKIKRGREPDLFFISKANSRIIKPTYIDGIADLAIEIVSPESVERDRVTKFKEYEAVGIREYWLIDPDAKTADFYELVDNRFQLTKVENGVFYSKVISGYFLRVEQLWEPLPPTLEAMRELSLV